MDERMAELLKSLNADGLTAFYVYLAVDTFHLMFVFGMIAWGISSIWPIIKKDMGL